MSTLPSQEATAGPITTRVVESCRRCIGSRAVIGAGSVVTRDIPDDLLAAGNPCRVIREIAPTPT